MRRIQKRQMRRIQNRQRIHSLSCVPSYDAFENNVNSLIPWQVLREILFELSLVDEEFLTELYAQIQNEVKKKSSPPLL